MDHATAIKLLKQFIKTFEGMEIDFKEMLKKPSDARDRAETHLGFQTIFGDPAALIGGDWGKFQSITKGFTSPHMAAFHGTMTTLQHRREKDLNLMIKITHSALEAGRKLLADLERGHKAA